MDTNLASVNDPSNGTLTLIVLKWLHPEPCFSRIQRPILTTNESSKVHQSSQQLLSRRTKRLSPAILGLLLHMRGSAAGRIYSVPGIPWQTQSFDLEQII